MPLRAELLALIEQYPNWTHHRDYYRLNSSEAMCWNGLMPALVVLGGLEALSAALGRPTAVEKVDLETILDAAEFTNFDSVLDLHGGGRVYIETKLTENEFGTAKPNDERERKRTGLYLPRLQGKVPERLLEAARFFANH